MISIKPVDLYKDAQTCIRFREDSFVVSFGDAEKFHEADGKGAQRYLGWLSEKIAKDPQSVVHVWNDNEIIGQIELGRLRDDQSRGYVNLYYLVPIFRGKGLGTHLDTAAMNYFKNLGLTSARLSVSPTNLPAVAYYKKMGWVDLGPRPEHPEVHFMEKNVDDLILSGKYVRLVPLTMDHAAGLVEAAGVSRKTYNYTSVPTDFTSAKLYIERALQQRFKKEAIAFATLDKKSGQLVGTTRFMSMEYWNCPEGSPLKRESGSPDVVEIGATWLSEPLQRTGINTDAKLLMLTHAFETWKVHRVTLKTDARNEKSRRNIERVGAKLDGILRAHMPAYDGAIRDTAFYSITASEWPTVRDHLRQRLTTHGLSAPIGVQRDDT